jgi:hypothetical protein
MATIEQIENAHHDWHGALLTAITIFSIGKDFLLDFIPFMGPMASVGLFLMYFNLKSDTKHIRRIRTLIAALGFFGLVPILGYLINAIPFETLALFLSIRPHLSALADMEPSDSEE